MGSTGSAPPGRAAGWSPTLRLPQRDVPCLGAGCAGTEKTVDHKLVQENHKTPISAMGHYHSSVPWAGLVPTRRNGKNYLTSKTTKKKILPGSTRGAQKHSEKPPLTENNDPKCL